MTRFTRRSLVTAAVACLLAGPESAQACSVCLGDPNSALGRGLFWGVIALLGVVTFVLSGIAAFFVYQVRRASRLAAAETGSQLTVEETAKV